ncbi:coiled-coil domain-containing protein 18 [Cheilinus undulatus]|uniref:coiled-coil domain-containing protein 18 n=1 Tax=Cheilinus undulatus TaxID=241271 RepID=UPI001BD45EC6|nr:coiled-coil domain-containing protein 18 [Cheilinus undulatus]
MKGTAKSKVVTSGRLTGRVKLQSVRRRISQHAASSPSCPEPAFSLYSTDSDNQVTTLHKGLDRCAALLDGILQAETTEALPSVPRALKGGAAKAKPVTTQGKKTIKKVPPQTDKRISRSVQHAAGSRTPKTPHQPARVPAAHSGVKLHPPQKHPHTPKHISAPPLKTQTSTAPPSSVPPKSNTNHCSAAEAPNSHCEGDDGELVPVRDGDTNTLQTSDIQLDHDPTAQRDEGVLQDSHGCREERVREAGELLGELRALIAGQGSAAEILLGHLEQTVSSSSSSLMKAADIQSESELQSQNAQLRRRVQTLQAQLKQREQAEKSQTMEPLCSSEVMILQDELTVAQSQLQELQGDLTELRKALQDTQSRLRESEARNKVILIDLEATRSRLLQSEREKSELASLAHKRLEEIENLNRILQSHDPSISPAVVDSQTSNQHFNKQQQTEDSAAPPSDRIKHYLLSLDQLDHKNTQQEEEHEPAERDTCSHPNIRPADSNVLLQQENHRRQLFSSAPSLCDRVSLSSDWSTRSGSTFNTKDEAAFRDGLAALDASIASLQKTIQLDLRR